MRISELAGMLWVSLAPKEAASMLAGRNQRRPVGKQIQGSMAVGTSLQSVGDDSSGTLLVRSQRKNQQ